MVIMQFSVKGKGNDNQRIKGKGEICACPPPVKMLEGPLTHGNCKTNRAQGCCKDRAAMEEEQGQPGEAGIPTSMLSLIL
jgi:hypothetical protein